MTLVLNTISVEKKPNKLRVKMPLKIFGLLLLFTALGVTGAYVYGNNVIKDFSLMFVSHTEYWLDDTGMIIVRITDYKGQPLSANCNASLIYQNDTYMFQNQVMSASALAGNYYYSFYLNSSTYPLGVYTKQVDCYVGNKNKTITTTLHVNPALEYLKTLGGSSSNITLELGVMNQTINNIKTDTQYIKDYMVTNTSFEDWKNNATLRFDNFDRRFDAIDGNITQLKGFCNDTETNSSDLCQNIWNILTFQQSTNVTYTNYFENITQTTTNTWNYMTGTLATNINNIYNLLVGVNQTVTNIQENVTAIRQDQIEDINVVIIS